MSNQPRYTIPWLEENFTFTLVPSFCKVVRETGTRFLDGTVSHCGEFVKT